MQELKIHVLEEYKKLLNNLHVGKQMNYDHILNMINALSIADQINNPEMLTEYFTHK